MMHLVCYDYIATVDYLKSDPEQSEAVRIIDDRVTKFLMSHPDLAAEGERQLTHVPVRKDGDDSWVECDVVDATGFRFTVTQPVRPI